MATVSLRNIPESSDDEGCSSRRRRNNGGRLDDNRPHRSRRDARRHDWLVSHPVIAQQPKAPKPWEPRTWKEVRDARMFHDLPHFMIPSSQEQEERAKEVSAKDEDTFLCIRSGCAMEQLSSPRSTVGKEAKRLRTEKLEAEAKVAAQTAATDKEAARKAKRAASQKASRQRKAATKKAVGGFVQLIKDATAALGPPRSLDEILDRATAE